MENIIQKHDQELMKRENIKLVLSIIKSKGPVSRAEISRIVGMSPTSVGRIVEELINTGLIKEQGQVGNGVGRKATLLKIDSESVIGIGVEVDKDCIIAGAISFSGKILKKIEISRGVSIYTPENVSLEIGKLVKKLIKDLKINKDKVIGIGVAFPGLVNVEKGEIELSAQLRWEKVKIREILQKELGDLPVIVDNEMKVKTFAESLYGMAKSSHRVALMSIGSGVGSALLISNKIYRGSSNTAGEIGHITIDPNGRLCDCGRYGCLQTYIADWALIEEANKFRQIKNMDEIIQAYHNNETWACSIISRAVNYIGTAIGILVCLYNPDTVILSGRLLGNYPEIAKKIEDMNYNYVWEPLRESFKLEFSQMGEDSAIIGAGTLALVTGLDEFIL